jgi:chromosome segregation ATPase
MSFLSPTTENITPMNGLFGSNSKGASSSQGIQSFAFGGSSATATKSTSTTASTAIASFAPASYTPKKSGSRSRKPLGFLSPNLRRAGNKVSKPSAADTTPTTSALNGNNQSNNNSTTAARHPLGFLSPNNLRRSGNKKLSDTSAAEIAELQSQVTELRERITILDGNTGRNELLERIEEKEQENKRNQQELERLTDKLGGIHEGLDEIEDERQALTEKATLLDQEKVAIQRELVNREREIASLAKRCSTQNTKMKEATKLRAVNGDLSRKVEQLKSALSRRDQDLSSVGVLQSELTECREARDQLVGRLDRLKKDHDAVAELLTSCQASVERLTEEKCEWEEERRRLLQRAKFDLEQLRLVHSHATIDLKQDVATREDNNTELETTLLEKLTVIQGLETQLAETKERADAAEKANEEQNRHLSALGIQHDESIREMKMQQEESLAQAASKLEEKSSLIEEMKVQQEESLAQLESKLEEKSSLIITLQEEVAIGEKLTEEKCEWEEERRRLLQQAKLDSEQQRLAHSQASTGFQQDVISREENIKELETNLHEKTTAAQRLETQLTETKERADALEKANEEKDRQSAMQRIQHEELIRDIEMQHEESLAQLASKLEEKSSLVVALKEEVAVRMQDVMAASSTLQKLEEDSGMLEDVFADIERLEHERFTLSEYLHERDTDIAELSAEILKLEIEKELLAQDTEKLDITKEKLAKSEEDKATIRVELEEELSQARATICLLEGDLRQVGVSKEDIIGELKHEQNEIVRSLTSKLQALEEATEEESKCYEDALASKDKALSSLQEELREGIADKAKIRAELEEELSQARDTICRLEDELRQVGVSNEESLGKLQHEKYEISCALTTLEEATEQESQRYEEALLSKDKALSSLQEELRERTADLTKSTDAHRNEMVALRQSLRKAKTELTLKDDDIRDLRMIEIPEHEETIASLKKEINRMINEMESMKVESTGHVADLESQILQLKSRSIDLEGRVTTRSRDQQAVIDQMSQSAAEMKREIDRNQTTERMLERKLEEKKMECAALSEKGLTIEKREEDLREDCNVLRSSIIEVENERDSIVRTLEREISRNSSSQGNDREHQTRFEGVKKELIATEAKLVQQEEQMATLEVALQERTTLLGDMVTHNKLLESKLSQLSTRLESRDEQSCSLELGIIDKEDELERCRADWKKKEDHYLEDIIEERHLREIAEADLETTRSRLRLSRHGGKDIGELEKENEALKDKVRRQEVYLQRKLEKDKALKDRSNATGLKTPSRAGALKTPARAGRTSQRRIQTPAASRATPASARRATQSSVASPESSSLDLDCTLNSLLED